MSDIPHVTPDQLARVRQSVIVLDVRNPEELAGGRIQGSRNVPLGQLSGWLDRLPRPSHDLVISRPIVTVCQSGRRSETAAALLTAAGFMVQSLAGGMDQWSAEGHPVD